MAGEIHGIISREDAWRMWEPFGERVTLEGYLDPNNITPFEAIQIAWGADSETQKEIRDISHDNYPKPWLERLKCEVAKGTEPALVDILVRSNEKQRKFAEQERQKAIDGGPAFVGLLGNATLRLVQEEVLTSSDAETIQSWMLGPDGLPFIQYTPMSQLEYARLVLYYDRVELDQRSNDSTDFCLGIIRSAVDLRPDTKRVTAHNKVHEAAHANYSGVEMYDVTREDGWRHPEATVLGHFAYEPSTEIFASDDFGGTENCEVNEGRADFLARELMRVEPRLGQSLGNVDGYGAWAQTIGKIRKDRPQLSREITKAALAEATPSNPHAKREALADLHAYADRLLGRSDSLTALFVDSGGSLLDIFTKGKAKAAIKQ